MTGATKEWADGKMLSEQHGAVGIVTFSRPEKRNAVSIEIWYRLGEIFIAFNADDNVRGGAARRRRPRHAAAGRIQPAQPEQRRFS